MQGIVPKLAKKQEKMQDGIQKLAEKAQNQEKPS